MKDQQKFSKKKFYNSKIIFSLYLICMLSIGKSFAQTPINTPPPEVNFNQNISNDVNSWYKSSVFTYQGGGETRSRYNADRYKLGDDDSGEFLMNSGNLNNGNGYGIAFVVSWKEKLLINNNAIYAELPLFVQNDFYSNIGYMAKSKSSDDLYIGNRGFINDNDAIGALTSYAIKQDFKGATTLNSKLGSPIKFCVSNNSKMILDGDGNLGIGTSNISEKLEVNGNVKATNFIGSGNSLTFNNGVTISRSTSNPILTLQTEDNSLKNGIAFQNSGNYYTWNLSRIDQGNNNADFAISGGGASSDINGLTEYFRIRYNNGNVGIGQSAPSEKLEVAGNVKAIGLLLAGDGAATNTIDSRIDGTVVFGGEDGSTLTNESIASSYYPEFSVWVEDGLVAEDLAIAPNNEWDATQPDYVFEESYKLPKLEEIEAFVKENKHLEGIPSKAEVAERGWSLPEMDQKLLKKIEELTLYTIEQEKRINELQKQMKLLLTRK